MWVTRLYYIDLFICHAWHSQVLFVVFLVVSIWNLVLISFERYLAICQPFHHQDLTKKKLWIIICSFYPIATLAMSTALFQTTLRNGECFPELHFNTKVGQTVILAYAIFAFCFDYVIPCILFFIFYGAIIQTFYRRRKSAEMASSRVIDKATVELTKTAIIVTMIFFVSIGYDHWYYLLAHIGVVEYAVNSFVTKVGFWFFSFNSAANPFVYALLMPAYRRSLQRTFSCK